MPKPLEGTFVVALEQAVSAPFCTQRLVDAGARVIKIERAGGDFARHYGTNVRGESEYFVWLNRGKESIVLDIKEAEDFTLLRSMIRKADVFVANLAPGATKRNNLSPPELRSTNPSLITCEISGYGPSGPLADAKAYDLLVQAESGLASVTGRPEGPGRVGVSICDIAAGLYAYTGILEAMIERANTGKGSDVSISMFDVMADWMAVPLLQYAHGGTLPARLGLHHPSIAPYGRYGTTDGGIMLAVQNQQEWDRFCRLVLQNENLAEDPRFATNEDRVRHREALEKTIDLRFSRLSRNEALELLARAEIASSSVNTVEDVWGHPQLRLGEADVAGGAVMMPPSALSESPPDGIPQLGLVPALNQQGPEIRKEFVT